MQLTNGPFEFILHYLPTIGWPAICYGIWKVTQFFNEVKGRATTAEEHVNKMATNCFPTMQTSLQNQDKILQSMDESLKTLVECQSPTPKRSRRRA